jgi:hypothetical protein
LPCGAIAQLPNVIAEQFLGDGANERADRAPSVFQQGGAMLLGQIRNRGELGRRGGSEQRRGGVAMDEFQPVNTS